MKVRATDNPTLSADQRSTDANVEVFVRANDLAPKFGQALYTFNVNETQKGVIGEITGLVSNVVEDPSPIILAGQYADWFTLNLTSDATKYNLVLNFRRTFVYEKQQQHILLLSISVSTFYIILLGFNHLFSVSSVGFF